MPLSEHVYCAAVAFKLTEQVEQWICIKFLHHGGSLNIPPWKLFRWFRRSHLRATGDWQLHHDNAPAQASHLMQNFLVKHQITQVTQPSYSPDLASCGFWLFLKQPPLKGKGFQTVNEIQKIQWSSWRRWGELCEVPRCLLWRGLRCYCPMDSVSCIFFNKCLFFLVHGWILTGQTSCPYL